MGVLGHAPEGVPVPAKVPAPALVLILANVILANVRIYGVGLFGLPGHVIPEGPRVARLLLGFLLQPRSLHLSLLGVSAGTACPGFLLARLEFYVLSLSAHLRGLFAVRFVPFLLQCPAATPRHQKHDQKDHHNNANNHPNPRCNVQATHLFPFAAIEPRAAEPAAAMDPLI